jgi:16S rRNA (cytosine1402-N4)-methyltransferase
MNGFHHVSVLGEEAVDWLQVRPGGVYVDCTLGGAGHSLEILSRCGPDGRLIAMDQDLEAVEQARIKLQAYGDRVVVVHSNFRYIKSVLSSFGFVSVDGVLFDLGVSSPQLDRAERGFSYHLDGPLDMRMDRTQPLTAYQIVNEWEEEELARIIESYGEERFAKRIAARIVKERSRGPIQTTGRLAEIVKEAIPAPARREGPHPARRTFQAIRVAVNDELRALEEAIRASVDVLSPQGRISVIAFHSLEDRIVKQVFSELSKDCICPKEFPVCRCHHRALLRVLTRKPVTPGKEERDINPRARSAKLRVAERTAIS